MLFTFLRSPVRRILLSRQITATSSPRSAVSSSSMSDTAAAAAAAASATPAATEDNVGKQQQPLVMQIIVDRELVKQPGWTRGPLMAQSAHAALAACTISAESRNTSAYLSPSNLAHMHKIVLQTPSDGGKTTLQTLSQRLSDARKEWEASSADKAGQEDDDEVPLHYLWIEQPENVPTCLALAPNRKPQALKKILNKCSLLRD